MRKILDFVPSWVWAALCLGLALTTCAERTQLQGERVRHSATKTEFAGYRDKVEREANERAQRALRESESRRELERFRNKAATEATNELLAETARTAAARARADERGRMLDALIDAAAPKPAGPAGDGDSAAVRLAEETAATLGGLLKTCRAEGRSDAGELEGLASQVRGLLSSYEALQAPRSKP